MSDTNNITGWDGNMDALSPDTLVMVKKSLLDKPALETEMRLVSEMGHSVWVRYDRHRERNRFTILIDSERVGDTDSPAEVLKTFRRAVKGES